MILGNTTAPTGQKNTCLKDPWAELTVVTIQTDIFKKIVTQPQGLVQVLAGVEDEADGRFYDTGIAQYFVYLDFYAKVGFQVVMIGVH